MGLNTTPRTWTTNELVTAAMMNTEVRDALTGIQAAWTSFTPTWTGTTNPVLGNGSFSGSAYLQVGKRVDFRIVLTMGSTTTYGTGQWLMTLPVAPAATARMSYVADYLDSSAGFAYTGSATWTAGGSVLAFNATPTTAGNQNRSVTSAVPFTWATTDVLTVVGTYEAA